MAVFAAFIGVCVAEADVRRSVQAECDRKERHGANCRVSYFPQCTQYAHCKRVYHNLLPTVKYGTKTLFTYLPFPISQLWFCWRHSCIVMPKRFLKRVFA